MFMNIEVELLTVDTIDLYASAFEGYKQFDPIQF